MMSDRPRRSLLAAFALVVGAALPGCMQSDTKTTLNADGSGTAVDVLVIDLEKTKQVLETMKMLGQMMGGGGPGGLSVPPDLDAAKWVEATYAKDALETQLRAVPGVEVKAVSSEAKDGKRTVRRDFGFQRLEDLGWAGFGTTAVELKKLDDGSWSLEMDALGAVRPLLATFGGGAPGDGQGMGLDPAALVGMVAEQVGDFRVVRTFTLPGTVLETNGKKGDDGRTVTWSFAIDDLKTAGADPKNAPGRMTVRFRGEVLTLRAFKYAPDLKEVATRMTPPAPKPADAPKAPETTPPAK